jgi:vancomycin permeability regulator SanA
MKPQRLVPLGFCFVGAALSPVGFVRMASRRYVARTIDTRCACVCVLGARVWPNGQVSTVLAQRLTAAKRLVSDSLADAIYVSGDDTHRAFRETTTMCQWLIDRQIDPLVIVEDGEGWSTATSARNLVSAMSSGVIPRGPVVIPTQGFVAARTAYVARRAGLDVVVLQLDTTGLYERKVLARMIAREIPACWKAILHVSKGVDGFTRRSHG